MGPARTLHSPPPDFFPDWKYAWSLRIGFSPAAGAGLSRTSSGAAAMIPHRRPLSLSLPAAPPAFAFVPRAARGSSPRTPLQLRALRIRPEPPHGARPGRERGEGGRGPGAAAASGALGAAGTPAGVEGNETVPSSGLALGKGSSWPLAPASYRSRGKLWVNITHRAPAAPSSILKTRKLRTDV